MAATKEHKIILCFITNPKLCTPYHCLVRETYHRWSVFRRPIQFKQKLPQKTKRDLSCPDLYSKSHLLCVSLDFPPRGVSPCCSRKALLLFRDSCLLLYVGVDKVPGFHGCFCFPLHFLFPTKTYFVLCVFVLWSPPVKFWSSFAVVGLEK